MAQITAIIEEVEGIPSRTKRKGRGGLQGYHMCPTSPHGSDFKILGFLTYMQRTPGTDGSFYEVLDLPGAFLL